MSKTEAFSNRLRKNSKHWDKWARRQGLSCYRLYDRDLPEFPLAIDRYAQHLHVQEFETDWEADDAAYDAWREDCFVVLGEVLDVPRERIHFKQRRRQRGLAQYEKTGETGEDFIVEEHGLKFWVNLDAYLDSGLFLDHRITRRLVRERAAGARFLNLFAYTGSFTVYAAAGGARSSVTVDMSNTYQDWSRRNFLLNGMDLDSHQLVRADVFQFLRETHERGDRYDLIVMDPPSFSNSKRMQGVLDVQRDHVELIESCLRILSAKGELFFSNNRRGFKLDEAALAGHPIRNLSRQTVPEDFSNKKIHQCWIIHQSPDTRLAGAESGPRSRILNPESRDLNPMFILHPQLQQDCEQLGRFELCHVLLMRDANYPWCILVPARVDITEIYQLDYADQQQLLRESSHLAQTMATLFNADKMNIAALGNVVPQLHIHHIARHRDDAAWPAPVWGKVAARTYTPELLAQTMVRLREALGKLLRSN